VADGITGDELLKFISRMKPCVPMAPGRGAFRLSARPQSESGRPVKDVVPTCSRASPAAVRYRATSSTK
jgi:hypothetical protein